jgi:MFS family permease
VRLLRPTPALQWPGYLLGSVALSIRRCHRRECSRFNQHTVISFADTVTLSTLLFILSTIADIYPKHVRGDKLSVFGVAVIIAPAVSPLIGSLVVNTHEWQIIYWIVLGLAGLQFAMFFLLVPETLWNQDIDLDAAMNDQGEMMKGGRVGPAWLPWHRPKDFAALFWNPIAMVSSSNHDRCVDILLMSYDFLPSSGQARFLPITLPSIYYGSLFACPVGITIIGPRLFEAPPYNFKSIPTGCTYLAFGLGAVLGKWVSFGV